MPAAQWFFLSGLRLHSQNRTTCSGLLKTALNNVLLPTLFNVVYNVILFNIVEPELAYDQV